MPKSSSPGGAKPPIHRLKKTEIVWLANHRCKHRHTYLDHYACYLEENPDTERIGFLDIEASNLKADFGIILSYAIKDGGSDKIYEGVLTPKDIKKAKAGDEDRRVVADLIRDLGNFDRVVTYYGTGFDIPFIRTRAVSMGIDFPVFGLISHTDLYYVVRNRFNLSSKRLENACRVLLGETDKTRVDAKYWRGGVRGEQASLDYIQEHNRYDVLDLEKLYRKIIGYAKPTGPSI